MIGKSRCPQCANHPCRLSYLPAAHKLALHDLGKAIAINPVGAENYYLRGDCHSKLGNYEQVRSEPCLCAQWRRFSSLDIVLYRPTFCIT
jgi:hypothetical protein